MTAGFDGGGGVRVYAMTRCFQFFESIDFVGVDISHAYATDVT